MKRSTSLFKKSPFADRLLRFAKHQHMPFVITVMTIASVVGCRIFQTSTEDAELKTEDQTETALGLKDDTDGHSAPLLSSTDVDLDVQLIKIRSTKHEVLGEMAAPTCPRPEGTTLGLNLRLFFSSAFGSHLAIVTLGEGASPDKAAVSIESRRLAFSVPPTTAKELTTLACLALEKKNGEPEIVADAALETMMTDWLAHVAPDCAFKQTGLHGFDCMLPQADAQSAKQEIEGIRSTMIRSWSRQPYLLSRRLAVTDLLAQALLSPDREKKLKTFCNIATHSLPSELPATLASHRWQDGVCRHDAPNQVKAALFGLAKAVDEIDFLRQLFERTSRLGSLTVRVPAGHAPNSTLWITLVPETGVTDNLTKETAKIWMTDTPQGATDAALAEGQPKACWHPVFGEDTGLLQLARHLVLAGEAEGVTCMEDIGAPQKSNFSLAHYLAESIASETEFVLQNGKSQTLRLPQGRYTYRIQGLPENPEEWDDAAANGPQSTGTLVWDSSRPRAVINQW